MKTLWLLVGLGILLPSTLIACYLISVNLGHVPAEFPYISDTGNFVPESCIFGQMLNMSAVLFGMIVVVRHVQLKHLIEDGQLAPPCSDFDIARVINTTLLVAGLTAALGVSVVANFQLSSVPVVHGIGALMAFGPPTLYFLLESIMFSFKITSIGYCPFWIAISRVLITFSYMLVGAIFIIFQFLHRVHDGTIILGESVEEFLAVRHWIREEGEENKWHFFITTTATEWVLAILILLFLLSFIPEFNRFEFSGPFIIVCQHKKRHSSSGKTVSLESELSIADISMQVEHPGLIIEASSVDGAEHEQNHTKNSEIEVMPE